MNAEVVIVTDQDINQEVSDRCGILAQLVNQAVQLDGWITTADAESDRKFQTYGGTRLKEIASQFLDNFNRLQSGMNRVMNAQVWKVSESYHKVIVVDSDSNMYVVAEMFEYDMPVSDGEFFIPCVAIGSSVQ